MELILLLVSLAASAVGIYMSVMAVICMDEADNRITGILMELHRLEERHEKDIDRIGRELDVNERSHGVLSMEIQELSKLKKTEDLRREVLGEVSHDGTVHREDRSGCQHPQREQPQG